MWGESRLVLSPLNCRLIRSVTGKQGRRGRLSRPLFSCDAPGVFRLLVVDEFCKGVCYNQNKLVLRPCNKFKFVYGDGDIV